MEFEPLEPLLTGHAGSACRACVVLPARNEAASLAETLAALAAQVDLGGRALSPAMFEVLLLLNNCTDESAEVVRAWQERHPALALHVVERELPGATAHIGTVRRWLMDTAWYRLTGTGQGVLLSTDADTLTAPDWIARNLAAIDAGADAVGGVIELREGELEQLPSRVRSAYLLDRRYQTLIAELEAQHDPQPGDPWPRHLEHFGASLACTPAIYARAGGLPAIDRLEDVGFVDRLRRVDARLRHDPCVVVYTSARLEGRVATGLSEMLRTWGATCDVSGGGQVVASATWLLHRFCMLQRLRLCYAGAPWKADGLPVSSWPARIDAARLASSTYGDFLAALDCDALIAETFDGAPTAPIAEVNRALDRMLQDAEHAGSSAWSSAATGRTTPVLVRI